MQTTRLSAPFSRPSRKRLRLVFVAVVAAVPGCLLQTHPETVLRPSPYFQSCDLEAIIDASMPKTAGVTILRETGGAAPWTAKVGEGVGVTNATRQFKGCLTATRPGKAAPVDPDVSDRLLRGIHQRLVDGLRAGGMHVTEMPATKVEGRWVEFEISFDRTDEDHNVRHVGHVKVTLRPSKTSEGALELTVTLTEDAKAVVY